jgi:hypothetical protein
VSSLPDSDEDDWDCEVVMTVIRFLVVLFGNLMSPPGLYVYGDEIKERSKRIFERLNNDKILNILFNLFEKYLNITHKLLIAATICYFHCDENLRPEMWIIIDLMKKTLEEYSCGKTIIKMNDIISILNSLRVVSRYYDNGKRLAELGFFPLLLKIISDKNFTVVQYALYIFRNLSRFFSSENVKQLTSANAFNIFSDLFKHFNFTTSAMSVSFESIDSALYLLWRILLNDSTSVELLMNTSLMQTIINILPFASSLAVYGLFTPQVELIIISIANILDICGGSVENIEKLFNFDCISPYLKTFEIIVNEREKGKTEFDKMLCEISSKFYNLSAGDNCMENPNDENSLFPTFQKINTPERLNNLFIHLKQLDSPSEYLTKCLYFLTLCVSRLFGGQKPLVSYGPVLECCDEMRKLPTPSASDPEGVDYFKQASVLWNCMKNPEDILTEWKNNKK